MLPVGVQALQDSFHFQSTYAYNSTLKNPPKLPKKPKSLYPVILVILCMNRLRKRVKKSKHRERILEQWHRTELSYNFDLRIVNEFIKKPMEEMKIINRQQSLVLFPQIKGMLQLSHKMLMVLPNAKKMKDPYRSVFGKELIGFIKEYRIYGSFFSSHAQRLKLLSTILNSSESHHNQLKMIQAKIQTQFAINKSNKQGMSIKDCMDQPLYRIFKYVLLLKEYLKKMPKESPDYEYVKKCKQSFHEINNQNNELMKKIEEKQKKMRLVNLFGDVLAESQDLILQTEARTIYHKVKIYVLNRVVLITKVLQYIGSEKQEKFGRYRLNQLSYVSQQVNLKYFKNTAVFISNQKCVHLFFNEEISKMEFIKCLQTVTKDLRKQQFLSTSSERYSPLPSLRLSKKSSRSSSSSQRETQVSPIAPQFLIQIVGFQFRYTGSLTSNNVYVIRFMVPIYYEDQLHFNEEKEESYKKLNRKWAQSQKILMLESTRSSQNSDKQRPVWETKKYCMNQRIQLSFSTLQAIYDHMQTFCEERIPQIDPLTRDVNLYAKGTKKTKLYEVRKFLIEEFLNFALRNMDIISHPSWFMSKLRINQDLWNYAVQRVGCAKNGAKMHGYSHCNICHHAKFKNLLEFQQLRDYYCSGKGHRDNKQAGSYCLNFLNLLRMRVLSLHTSNFNTTQRILLYYHYLQGRLDYPFLLHNNQDKTIKLIKIFMPSIYQKYIQVQIDPQTTVGEVLDELSNVLYLTNCFDFDLIASCGGVDRILDRDQYVGDVVKAINIGFEECEVRGNVVKKKSKFNVFSALKELGNHILQTTSSENKLYFAKTIYFSKSLQTKSFDTFPQKKHLEIQKIYWQIHKGRIKFTTAELVQRVALFCCLKQFDSIANKQIFRASGKLVAHTLPDQYSHVFQYEDQFKKEISVAIQRESFYIIQNKKSIQYVQSRILELSFDKYEHRTFYVEVQPKQIPPFYLKGNKMPEVCLLGINYKLLVVVKKQVSKSIIFTLPIGEIDFYLSIFSLFISYETWNFRFDGKMLHHIGEMIKKYQTVLREFPHFMG